MKTQREIGRYFYPFNMERDFSEKEINCIKQSSMQKRRYPRDAYRPNNAHEISRDAIQQTKKESASPKHERAYQGDPRYNRLSSMREHHQLAG